GKEMDELKRMLKKSKLKIQENEEDLKMEKARLESFSLGSNAFPCLVDSFDSRNNKHGGKEEKSEISAEKMDEMSIKRRIKKFEKVQKKYEENIDLIRREMNYRFFRCVTLQHHANILSKVGFKVPDLLNMSMDKVIGSESPTLPFLFQTGVALGMFRDIKEMRTTMCDSSSSVQSRFKNEGNVFSAYWGESSTKVVLKYFDLPSVSSLSSSSSFRTLLRSALSARACGECKYIVPLFCAFRDDHVHDSSKKNGAYLVFPFYPQGDMIKWLHSSATPTLSQIYNVLRCVLSALSFLHNKGIVHCDLKPQNVLIDKEMALLCDFEGAVDCSERTYRLFSRTMRIITKDYTAPELLDVIDARVEHPHPRPSSDMYSFGVLVMKVFEILQGIPMPEDLKYISSICTKKDPEHRLTASEVLKRLKSHERKV
ncbi:hypothetical protein ADUPG1_000216, partial [Aduncisulcus paluster]